MPDETTNDIGKIRTMQEVHNSRTVFCRADEPIITPREYRTCPYCGYEKAELASEDSSRKYYYCKSCLLYHGKVKK